MSSYTIDKVIANYDMLSHEDPIVRENANIFLMGFVYEEEAWKTTQEMITLSSNSNHHLLGAQILHQKLEKEIAHLQKDQLNFLKNFLFAQLHSSSFSVPTIHKLCSSASLIAVVLCLDEWQDLIGDIVKFMGGSLNQLQNGLILLGSIAQQLSRSNGIKQGIKIKVKEKILEQEALVAQIFQSTLTLNEQITNYALETIESWVIIGFPLMKYKSIISIIILLIQQRLESFLEPCCKILSESMKIAAQNKTQTLTITDFSAEMMKYSAQEIQSLKIIILHIQNSKIMLFEAIGKIDGNENIELYTSLVKEMLLSFGFLLLENIGFELVEIMVKVIQSRNLKLSYSSFQFWLDFCEKLSKVKVDKILEEKIWNIIQYLYSTILQKTMLENNGLLYELIKDQDTLDDIDDISFYQYRKEAQYLIKFSYQFFTKKKEREGSNLFFKKLLVNMQKDQTTLGIYTQIAIYAVKSSLESMMKDYDTQNLTQFIQYLIGRTDSFQQIPPKIAAEIMGLIKDCNREIKERDHLFLKSLSFSLKYIEDQNLCHYAVYAFQSLMESIDNISSSALINDLLSFYQSRQFTKQVILQKVLDGILTSITKLTDKNSVIEYFNRIMNAIILRNNAIMSKPFHPESFILPLIEIKTVLDCFDHISVEDKIYFRNIFLSIADQGITIVTRIVKVYLERKLKFTNVNQLGLSLAVCRNSLKICEGVSLEYLPISSYVTLMNSILPIFEDPSTFSSYYNLVQIITKILGQFMGNQSTPLNSWLGLNLIPINSFFLNYAKMKTNLIEIDPDFIKEYYAIQESVLIYSQQIFLNQPSLEQIFDLALISLQLLNEKQMQRKIINFLLLCSQIRPVFGCKFDHLTKSIFAAVPNINNICYINLGRIFIVIFQGSDLKKKQSIFRALLELQPYTEVDRDLKEILAKFLSFAIDTKIERYIKGVLSDMADIRWKKSGQDLCLHLQMRFTNWKREYKRMVKGGEVLK